MGVIRNFYNSHSFFLKVMKFAFGLFLNEPNFPPFCFTVETSIGHNMKYAWQLRCLNRYVRVFLNHDAVTMHIIVKF